MWSLPGGAIEANESIAQAAIREVLEETGIQIELTRLVGIYSRPQWRAGGDHAVVFAGKPLTYEIAVQPEEALETDYFPLSRLPELLLWWAKERINDACDGATGIVRLQDAVWPFERDEDWRKRMEEHSGAPGSFYEDHLTEIGPQGEKVEVPGTAS